MTFVHLDVTHFSPTVYREIKATFDHYRPLFPAIIFTQPSEDTELFQKFVARFGFKPLSEGVGPNGQPLRYYIHIEDNIGSGTDTN